MKDAENASWQTLSELADGEADAVRAAHITAAWRDDSALRERWHAYQLIGDVLRSDELAGHGGEAAFLQRLRGRLAQEPVVLAPPPWVAGSTRPPVLRRWARPAAVAAGFVMVAGALSVMRLDAPAPAAPQLAVQQEPVAVPAVAALVGPLPGVTTPEAAPPERVEVANGVLIRDARLDAYLAAHQQFGGSAALGLPASFLRGDPLDLPSTAGSGTR